MNNQQTKPKLAGKKRASTTSNSSSSDKADPLKPVNEGIYLAKARKHMGRVRLPARTLDYHNYIKKGYPRRARYLTKNPDAAKEVYNFYFSCYTACNDTSRERFEKSKIEGQPLAKEICFPPWLTDWRNQLVSFELWLADELAYVKAKGTISIYDLSEND